MRNKHLILLPVLLVLFCMVPEMYGQAKANKLEIQQGHHKVQTPGKPVGYKRMNKRTGLYSTRNKFVAQGIALNLSALYYYGDIDMLDQAFVHGFQPQNLTLSGSLQVGYLHPLANFANWRFSAGVGYLHGNDSARYDVDESGVKVPAGKGKFNSVFGEFSAGVEFYPFPRSGFYIYAGLGLTVSYINYDFYKRRDRPEGSTVSVLPMLPVEIGYNFYLGRSCYLGLSVSVHQGLLDCGGANLDAWPLKKTSVFQWGDGYFQVGLTFSYRWHKCEACRVLK